MTDLTFLDYHKPILPPGRYTLSSTQTVKAFAQTGRGLPAFIPSTTFQTDDVTFFVGGPAAALMPADVVSVFPPEGSSGDHAHVLPHIVLTDATLPYTRPLDTVRGAPCLALLVLTDDELSDKGSPIPFRPVGPSRPAVERITLEGSVLRKAAPRAKDLPLLTHVRRIAQPTGGAIERGVVLAARLPQAGTRNTCLLVDLDGLYSDGVHIADATRRSEITVLRRWAFTVASHAHSFESYMTGLKSNAGLLHLPEPEKGKPDAGTVLRQRGWTILPMSWRHGSEGAALYRGPLCGAQREGAVPERPDPFEQIEADSLLEFHEPSGLFDVSYAAAWELGRLSALASGGMARALVAHGRRRKRAEIAGTRATGPVAALAAAKSATGPIPPDGIHDFLDRLARLEEVPFRYLIPDNAMLPPESLRFFEIDSHWIDCLLAGALSLGRARGDTFDPALLPTATRLVCGALLRTNLVTDWPSLVFEGSVAGTPAPVLPARCAKLSPSVLLLLFDREISTLDIHPHPEVMHHGLTARDEVELRQLDGELTGTAAAVGWADRAARLLSIKDTASHIETKLMPVLAPPASWPSDSSAAIALQLVRHVERGRFAIARA